MRLCSNSGTTDSSSIEKAKPRETHQDTPADFRGYFIALMWDQKLVGDHTNKGGTYTFNAQISITKNGASAIYGTKEALGRRPQSRGTSIVKHRINARLKNCLRECAARTSFFQLGFGHKHYGRKSRAPAFCLLFVRAKVSRRESGETNQERNRKIRTHANLSSKKYHTELSSAPDEYRIQSTQESLCCLFKIYLCNEA